MWKRAFRKWGQFGVTDQGMPACAKVSYVAVPAANGPLMRFKTFTELPREGSIASRELGTGEGDETARCVTRRHPPIFPVSGTVSATERKLCLP